MKKLFENWNVSMLKDEIYVVNIITTSKSCFVGRYNDTTYFIQNSSNSGYEEIFIPEFLPKDKKYMYAENFDKFHYQCFYIPYTIEDIRNTKIILTNDN